MAKKITYTCDQCKKVIGELYGPIHVTVVFESEQIQRDADLCSTDCMKSWTVALSEEAAK